MFILETNLGSFGQRKLTSGYFKSQMFPEVAEKAGLSAEDVIEASPGDVSFVQPDGRLASVCFQRSISDPENV